MTSMKIGAGDLRERVTLQQRAAGVNSLNEPNGAWGDVITVWARVVPMRSRDKFAAGQAQVEADMVVTIRYRTGVTSDMRLVWRGQVLEMVGQPANIEAANRFLEILCLKGPRNG